MESGYRYGITDLNAEIAEIDGNSYNQGEMTVLEWVNTQPVPAKYTLQLAIDDTSIVLCFYATSGGSTETMKLWLPGGTKETLAAVEFPDINAGRRRPSGPA